MNGQKVKVKTFKLASYRYIHHIEVPERGYFHLVTDSPYFSVDSLILRNEALSHNNTKEIRGLKEVREEREEWLSEDSWSTLCFGRSDNLELRKKIYGKELRKIELEMFVYPRSGKVEVIRKKEGADMIPGRSVWIGGRSLKKRIKDPLPYIVLKQVKLGYGEKPICFSYSITELSYLMFKRRLDEWYGSIFHTTL